MGKETTNISKTFMEDMNTRLPDVQRWWLRLPVTLLATPICFLMMLAVGIFEAISYTAKFFYECWTGEEIPEDTKTL